MSHDEDGVLLLYVAQTGRVVVGEDLKNRILASYQSDALARHLEDGSEQALYVLSQLVHLNFNAERILYLSQEGNCKAIAEICKEYLEGQALLTELHRVVTGEPLH